MFGDGEIALRKIRAYGIRGTVSYWFRQYLSDGDLLLDGTESSKHADKCGVRQGSVMEPMFISLHGENNINNNIVITKGL